MPCHSLLNMLADMASMNFSASPAGYRTTFIWSIPRGVIVSANEVAEARQAHQVQAVAQTA